SLALCSSNSGTCSSTHGSSRRWGLRTSAIVPAEHPFDLCNVLGQLAHLVPQADKSGFQNRSVHLECRHRRNCSTEWNLWARKVVRSASQPTLRTAKPRGAGRLGSTSASLPSDAEGCVANVGASSWLRLLKIFMRAVLPSGAG